MFIENVIPMSSQYQLNIFSWKTILNCEIAMESESEIERYIAMNVKANIFTNFYWLTFTFLEFV